MSVLLASHPFEPTERELVKFARQGQIIRIDDKQSAVSQSLTAASVSPPAQGQSIRMAAWIPSISR
jgi:hypothetical protein